MRTLRPRDACGPCCGERTGSSGPHACACAGGSRASWRVGGCSAGTYACSRESPAVGDGRLWRPGVLGLAWLRRPDRRHWSTRSTSVRYAVGWTRVKPDRAPSRGPFGESSRRVSPGGGDRGPDRPASSGSGRPAPCGELLDPQGGTLLASAVFPSFPHGQLLHRQLAHPSPHEDQSRHAHNRVPRRRAPSSGGHLSDKTHSAQPVDKSVEWPAGRTTGGCSATFDVNAGHRQRWLRERTG